MAPTQIAVAFTSRRQALEYSRFGGHEMSLFVPTSRQPPLRAEVVVDITFGDGAGHFLVFGVVHYHRAISRGPQQPPGVVVAFETTEQRKKASELLAFCAGRPLSDGTATSHRNRVTERCIVHVSRATVKGCVRDLSATGAFVAATLPRSVKAGAELDLQVNPWLGRFGGKWKHAKIIWVGQKYGLSGFGARFVGS